LKSGISLSEINRFYSHQQLFTLVIISVSASLISCFSWSIVNRPEKTDCVALSAHFGGAGVATLSLLLTQLEFRATFFHNYLLAFVSVPEVFGVLFAMTVLSILFLTNRSNLELRIFAKSYTIWTPLICLLIGCFVGSKGIQIRSVFRRIPSFSLNLRFLPRVSRSRLSFRC